MNYTRSFSKAMLYVIVSEYGVYGRMMKELCARIFKLIKKSNKNRPKKAITQNGNANSAMIDSTINVYTVSNDEFKKIF
ncbi:hypothetical protein ACA30_05800 [Virgibacillus soli]|nr:hypothetical protein ACA30_05800 [Virgibacillus soli]